MQYARARGATTIGFTGCQPSSQLLVDVSHIVVQAPLTMIEQIEDVHVILHHMITAALRERIATSDQLAREPNVVEPRFRRAEAVYHRIMPAAVSD
jgi:hypothetical protein